MGHPCRATLLPAYVLIHLPASHVAFQAVSPVNNVAADYTHLYDGAAAMQGGVYVYAQLNANNKSIALAYMLSSGNEVRGFVHGRKEGSCTR